MDASPDPRRGRVVWLSWHWHRRTETLVRRLGVPWVLLDSPRRGIARYAVLLCASLRELWRLRRSTVIVQSPSVALAAMAILVAPLLRLRIVIDAHNEAVRPFTHDTAPMRFLLRQSNRRARLVIVTNDELAMVVSESGGRPFVLPDAMPAVPAALAASPPEVPGRVLIVCTYASDEPLEIFIDAVRKLDAAVEVRLTGKPSRAASDALASAPPNLTVLGYLRESDYWAELAAAELVVDLTLKPNCLVCGAYEAIAAGRVPVLSDDVSSRRLFGEVAILTRNDANSLAAAIRDALARTVRPDLESFRVRYERDWSLRLETLKARLDALP